MKIQLLYASLLATFLPLSLLSQDQDQEKKPQKTFEFGVGIEYNKSDILLEGPQNSSISLATNNGFGTSVLAKYNPSYRISVLLESIISFREQNLVFTDIDGNIEDINGLNEVTIDVPLLVSYLPFNNVPLEPRVLLGPRYRYNIVSEPDDILSFRPHQFSFDVGVSFDFKLSHFTMRPMLVYTRGLGNILDGPNGSGGAVFRMDAFSFKLLFFG